MKKQFSLVCFLLAVLAPALAGAGGVLVDARGTVTVTAPGKPPAPGKVGVELPDGTTVAVAAGGAATVLQESGALDELAAGTTVAVGSGTQAAKTTSLGGGIAVAMRELSSSGSAPTAHGMVKEVAGPFSNLPLKETTLFGIAAIAPVRTAVRMGPQLAFRWNPTPPVDWAEPALVIDDAKHAHVVVRPLREGAREAVLDAALAGLKKGTAYTWFLASQQGGIKGKTVRFEFSLLSAGQEKRLAAEEARIRAFDMSDEGKDLLVAQLLLGNKMNSEAVDLLVPLWEKTQAPFVKKLLAYGYTKMGRGEEAARYK